MWVYDLETLTILAVNAAALGQYGYTREEFLCLTIADLRDSGDVAEMLADVHWARRGGRGAPRVWRHVRKDGEHIDVEVTAQSVEINGRAARLVMARDVTTERALNDAVRVRDEQLRQAHLLARLGTWEWNIATGVVLGSQELYELVEITAGEPLTYAGLLATVIDEDRVRVQRATEAAAAGGSLTTECRVHTGSGSVRWLHVQGRFDATGPEARVIGVSQDITDRKLAEQALAHQAMHDPLTDAANRELFTDRLAHALGRLATTPARWRCCFSTSTGSSRSTTASATTSATACSSPWPAGSGTSCAPRTRSPVSVETSSRSCARTSSVRPTPRSWRRE
jgi:PAS domain S-box-containing protein